MNASRNRDRKIRKGIGLLPELKQRPDYTVSSLNIVDSARFSVDRADLLPIGGRVGERHVHEQRHAFAGGDAKDRLRRRIVLGQKTCSVGGRVLFLPCP